MFHNSQKYQNISIRTYRMYNLIIFQVSFDVVTYWLE